MSRLLTSVEAQDFEHILDDYQPNTAVLNIFQDSNFAVIAGPAGAGKDTLRDGLIDKYPEKYVPILSTTTRPPRDGEVDGVTYHFRDIEEVRQGLLNQEFFQTALVHNQQVSCLHVSEVQKLEEGQCGLSILIPPTEKELRAIKPDIKTLFLIPPDLGILKARMQANRELDQEEINRRLQAAEKEMTQALGSEHYYCLVSDTVPHILQAAHDFLQTNKRNLQEDKLARLAIGQILAELRDS